MAIPIIAGRMGLHNRDSTFVASEGLPFLVEKGVDVLGPM
jgi:hypothetical protein